jgi:PAS domain S-box-containing protein
MSKREVNMLSEISVKIFSFLNFPIIVMDPQTGFVLYINQAFIDLTGFTSQEVTGRRPPFPFWPQDNQDLYATSLKDGQASRMEWSMLKKNGENILVESSISLIPEDNNRYFLVIALKDITEQKKIEAALKESEAYKDSLLTQAPDPIVVYGPDNRIEYVNPAFEKLTGFIGSEVLGISPPFPWWPTQNIVSYAFEIQTIRHLPLEIFERVFQKKNGELFWVSLKVRHTDEIEKKNQHIANWIDITEQKKAEVAFKESEAFKASLLDDAPNPIVVTAPDSTIIYVNPALTELTGFTNGELVGEKTPYPWWNKDYRTYIRVDDSETNKIRRERLCKKKNGEPFWFAVSIKTVRTDHEVQYYIANCLDITEQKRAEAALKESEDFVASLMSYSPNPVMVVNPDSSIRFVNPAFEKMTGYSSQDVLGTKFPYPWWSSEDVERYEENAAALHADMDNQEKILVRKDGSLVWISLSLRVIRDKSRIKYVLGNWVDITERKKTEEALRESEAFNTSLLENAPNPVMVVNPDSSISYVNPALEKITGYSRSEILGKKTPYPWWPKETVAEYINTPSRRTEEFEAQERRLIHKNGTTVWITLSVRAIRENGRAKHIITNWVDITERKKAEDALKESEAYKTSLLDDAPNPIFVTDQERRIIYINPALEKLSGFSNAELIGKKPPYPWWPEDKIEKYDQEGLKLRAGIIGSTERMCRKKNGEVFWTSVSMRNIKKDAKILYSITIWADITLRKKMEEELKESEAFSSSLLNEAPNPVVVFSPDGTIKYANPALEKLTGFDSSEVIGTRIPHPWWPREKCSQYTRESVIGTNKIVTMKERYFCKKNGDPFWVAISMRHIMENEIVKYTLSNWVDITDLKKMEKKISELYDQEKKQREELQEEAKARGLFINVLAHELRAPLTPIMASTGILKDLLEPRQEDILKRLAANIHNSTEKLSIRLEELLDLARYDRGTFRLNLQEVVLYGFLEAVLTRFEPGLIKRHQHLTTSIVTNLFSAEIDPSRVEQVIINFLSNASKYSAEEAEIIFNARIENRQLLVEVQDRGVGISRETQKELFRPYHRVEQDRKQFPGLGLGLAVSKQIIDAHGGKIWVTSQVGQGSSFFFSVPLKQK